MAFTERYVSVAGAGAHDGTSEANAFTLAEAITHSASNTAQRYNTIAGTYANTTSNLVFNGVGTATAPNIWRGYKTTIGDQIANMNPVPGVDVPDITFTTGQLQISGGRQYFFDIASIGATTASGGLCNVTSVFITMDRVSLTNTAVNANSRALTCSGAADGSSFINCKFTANGAAGAVVSFGDRIDLIGCYITGGTIGASCTAAAAGQSLFYGCIFSGQGGDCINSSVAFNAISCTFYNAVGDGIEQSASAVTNTHIINCIFESITGTAIKNSSGANITGIKPTGNGYRSVGATLSGITEDIQFYPAASPSASYLTNGGSGDFRPSTEAKGAGFQDVFFGRSFSGTPDLGAVQGPVNEVDDAPIVSSAGYVGDYPEDATVRFRFNTRNEGVPATLSGATVVVYKDGNTTPLTTGVTLTTDFDGITGVHDVTVDMSASASYTTESDYDVILTAGTVNGIDQTGSHLGRFTCGRLQVALQAAIGDPVTQEDFANACAQATVDHADFVNLASDASSTLSTSETILDRSPDIFAHGTTTGSPTTTVIQGTGTDLSSTDDFYNDQGLFIWEGPLKGSVRKITDYTGSSKTFVVEAFPTAPASGIDFVIGSLFVEAAP